MTRRIELRQEGREWVEGREQWVRHNGEDPNSVFRLVPLILSTESETNLNAHIGESGAGITLQRISGSVRGREYGFVRGSETWYVSQGRRGTMVIRSSADELKQIVFSLGDVFSGSRVNFEFLRQRMDEAGTRRESERQDRAGLRGFDIPRNARTGYIGLYDLTDPTELSQMEHFPAMMNSLGRGYNLVSDGPHVHGVDRNPVSIVRDNVRNMYAQGIRNFFINMSVHGSTDSIGFMGPDGRVYSVQPSELQQVFNEFQDARFTVSLNACHGGGFNSANYTDLGESGRVTVFVQTKPELVNPIFTTNATRTRDVPGRGAISTEFSSPYDYYMVYYLRQGMPYGQAHLAADQRVKQIFPGLDAGAFRSGRDGGMQTAGLERRGVNGEDSLRPGLFGPAAGAPEGIA